MGILPTQTYHKIYKNHVDSEDLRTKLKLRYIKEKQNLFQKHPYLDTYLKQKSLDLGKLRAHSAKILSAGAITGALLLSSPDNSKSLPDPYNFIEQLRADRMEKGDFEMRKILSETLKSILPQRPHVLDVRTEKLIEQIVSTTTQIPVKASLEGEHLNTIYGLIGYEQHLKRYPGDNIKEHGEGYVLKAGMAPGLGAWGYVAKSKDNLDPYLTDVEKWYAVVQTLYLPDWGSRQPFLKDWYKHRKLLIVNTQNGNAVITAIVDSGPAMWTGKNFGGSPEVMDFLGGEKYRKGPVLVLFVDDPESKIPLGPVSYNNVKLAELRN